MKQIDLLSITPLSIVQYVRERLRGFPLRHAARVAKRKQDRARREATPEDQKRKRVPGMRVIFRAEFQGPRPFGPLNLIGANLARVTMTVDILRKGDRWIAKSNGHALKLETQGTHGSMKDVVAECFDAQLSKWTLCDAEGKALEPDYVNENPQGEFSMREVTHCGSRRPEDSAPTPTGPNYFRAACGQEVHAALLRSFRAARPPLCKECRKEWEKTPQEERFHE